MILRRAHDLHFPLQIADAGGGTIATNLEQALVVFPREIVKDDDLIGVRRVVVFAKRGVPRHDQSISPGTTTPVPRPICGDVRGVALPRGRESRSSAA